ncbi:MAG: glycosyltransferase [Prosthecochloris sp.]|uniref:glycosyltransferase n=1 Tax=Prosthecochloris sp. TaxID=290513 RepID=UPI0013C82F81|nr:glycosyltransferase [Prosthecochloris sp.]NEX12379.1 glycosyltransferase [Prosthecochloris sp.]
MNIAFINSARTWGGTEKWTLMASEALSREHHVHLVYRRDTVGRNFSVSKHRLPLVSHLELYSLVRLVRLIQKEQIDILIPTKRKDYVLAGLASRICGITNILRLGIDRRLRIPVIHKLIYRDLADGIIVNAEKTRQTLLLSPFMVPEHIRVIYNGLDTAALDARTTSTSLPGKPARFLVSAMGILTLRKGFDFLIKGFAGFLRKHPDADAALVIIGDGPEHETFSKLAEKLGISRHVIFTGFLENPFGWLKQSDVFAMTSQNEGIPNALLEAMHLENAPVCTRAGGTEEFIDNAINGFLCDYGDEQTLTATLTRLYRNPDLVRTVSENARKKVMKTFCMEKMQNELARFCSEILRK